MNSQISIEFIDSKVEPANGSNFVIDTNYQTPLEVCNYMADLIPDDAISILEPTPGMGNIVRVLESRNKFNVHAADDFFLLDQKSKFDCIIMNPPFSSKSAFMDNAPAGAEIHGMKLGYFILQKCMEMSNNVIALMPWYTLSDSDVRMRFLKAYGIKSLTTLPRKTFEYARIQTVIIELHKGYTGDTIFRTYDY